VSDASGRTVFESGASDKEGRIRRSAGESAAHQDVITQPGQAQIYEAVMGDAKGQVTRSLLRAATYLKDNRLPPHGFRPDGPEHDQTAIRGDATQDANFNAGGSGRDQVTYRIDLGSTGGKVVAELELLYQSVPPEAVARLLQGRGPAAKEFSKLYGTADKRPETVHQARIEL
jgi:hypothetical protein